MPIFLMASQLLGLLSLGLGLLAGSKLIDRIHLEFTHADGGSPCPAPTRDNLLVLYILDQQAFRNAVHRLEEAGHQPVEPENPYWRNHGKTYEDPDGWRVVLYDGRAFEN